MKDNKIIKIVGIFLMLSLVITIVTSNLVSITALSLLKTGTVVSVAASETATTNASGESTTAGGSSVETLPADTDAAGTVATTAGTNNGTTSSANGTSSTTKKNSAGTTSTTKATSTTKTKAEIATLYNNAVNKTKAFTGKVKMHRVQGTTTEITALSIESVRDKAQEMLPNDYPKTKDATYNGGKNTADASELLSKQIPPSDDKKAALSAAGISTFTYTATSTGYKITMVLVKETGNDVNYVPPYHASIIDTLSITADDLKPFTLKEASVVYPGATITATVNKNGCLTALSVNEPVTISGKLSLGFSIDAAVAGLWRQSFTFTY